MDIGTSSGLAFASGINAYLPLLSLALASDFWPNQFKINPQFAFITQGWCIAILALLTLADFFADKIPGVDHLWDVIHTFIRPVAGAIVAAAANPNATGGWLPIALTLGAGLAGITHTTKAATRVASTVTTAGCMNIVLSFIEDIVAVVSVILALLVPNFMLVVTVLFVLAFLIFVPRIIGSIRRKRQQRQMRNQANMPYAPVHPGSGSPGHF
jgi:Domain of unknown function (DUF4126)